jgi:hypothetical protein
MSFVNRKTPIVLSANLPDRAASTPAAESRSSFQHHLEIHPYDF